MLLRLFNDRNHVLASVYLDELEPDPAAVIEAAAGLVRKRAPRGRYVEAERGTRRPALMSAPTVILAQLGAIPPEKALERDFERVRDYRYRRRAAE